MRRTGAGRVGGCCGSPGQAGQALLEVLVALFVISLAALSLTGLATATTAGLFFERERAQAGTCAQAALEAARAADVPPQGLSECDTLAGGPPGATASVTVDSQGLWKATVVSHLGTVLADVYFLPPTGQP